MQRAQGFAAAVSLLTEPAAAIVLSDLGSCRDAKVARRCADHAREAVASLDRLAVREGASMDEAFETATWAMTSAAVALGQVRIHPPRGFS